MAGHRTVSIVSVHVVTNEASFALPISLTHENNENEIILILIDSYFVTVANS